jgi:hypothetical protein
LTPSLVGEDEYIPKAAQALIDEYGYDTIDPSYRSVNPYYGNQTNRQEPQAGGIGVAPAFPENESVLLQRMQTTIRQLLAQVGEDHHLMIVSHAPCNLGVALALEGCIDTPKSSKLIPWPLGGLTQFVRQIVPESTRSHEHLTHKNKQTRKIETDFALQLNGDTAHMPGEYAEGLQAWTLPCLT